MQCSIYNQGQCGWDFRGGIAQLVERQLCKLEVRGSNPLASSLRSRPRGERRLSRRSRSRGEGGQFIFDLRFAIADLSKCARSATRRKSEIDNRKSEVWRRSR